MPQPTSTRWSPTPDQLMILEEMYKSGLRTPNAPQIQNITAHLSYYGKIEGKNVFYWFQNHKARDRQKLRRKLSKQPLQEQMLSYQKHHGQSCNNFKLFGSIHHPMICHQPSHDKSSAQCPDQGGAEGALPNYKRKLDNPDIQKEQDLMSSKSHTDDWMMMMLLREACDKRPCCSNTNRPLKTLQLFPIKGPRIKEAEEQLCHAIDLNTKSVS